MRSLVLASALAVAALSLGAGMATADDSTCTTTDDAPFAGTYVCVRRTAPITGTNYVPYYVGPVCVGSTCTTPLSGTIAVPVVDAVPVDAWGQVCYTNPKYGAPLCKAFTTDDINKLIGSGRL